MKTPRLKNLMQLSKALVLVSDGLSNLTTEDAILLKARFTTLPEPAQIEAVADWIIDRVVQTTFAEMSKLTGLDEISVFCLYCEQNTPHTLHHEPRPHYKCVKCGIVEEAEVVL